MRRRKFPGENSLDFVSQTRVKTTKEKVSPIPGAEIYFCTHLNSWGGGGRSESRGPGFYDYNEDNSATTDLTAFENYTPAQTVLRVN